jgi:glycosyltransferase involved in cell wall biosynthesis
VTPQLSVIIPTCNRRPSVVRLLRAIANDPSAPTFEVIVVDDGSCDDTVATLEQLRPAFPLRVLSQRAAGPSSARNAGARAACGRVLLFLDDDVEPLSGTLARHVAFHAERDDLIGVGDLPPVVADTSFIGITLRGWWERMLHDFRKPGHRAGFRNVLTGHLSIHRARFEALGGFDLELRCHEDWEFGYRGMKAGMQIRFVVGASAWHHETSTLTKILKRKFDEGVADVQLASRHPELTPALPFYWPPSRKAGVLMRLAWRPAVGAVVERALHMRLHLAEALRTRGRWRAILNLLLAYSYWRGVASVVPDRRTITTKRRAPYTYTPPEACIDLRHGIDRAAKRLDLLSPRSAALFFGNSAIGIIHDLPGLEPLRGEHLRSMLAVPYYRTALRKAMQKAGALPPVLGTGDDSTHASRRMPYMSAPVVRDEQLAPQRAASLDTQHRAAVPPVHDVA